MSDGAAGRHAARAVGGRGVGATRVVLASGTGPVGTGRFLLGSKTDAAGGLMAEEWLAVLFVPILPRRSLSLRIDTRREEAMTAVVEPTRALSAREVASRFASSLAGAAAALLTLALVYASSSNTGLFGGLLVVTGGGLLAAAGGFLDWRRPRIRKATARDAGASDPGGAHR